MDLMGNNNIIMMMRMDAFLRICAILLLLTTAALVRFDSQTSLIFPSFSRTASFTDINVLFVLVLVDITAAGYNLIQLVIRLLFSSYLKPDITSWASYKHIAWVSFLLDQAAVYMVFSANAACLATSAYAITGDQHHLFWMKLCNKFTRFCTQIGGALLCGYVAFIFMAMLSFLSAYTLFRHYSPKYFLVPK